MRPRRWRGYCWSSPCSAWAGTALFLILPASVQITTDTLAESWLLLFVLVALWCLVRAVREPRAGWFALTGLLAGCGYLVRLEALLIPATAVLLLITQRWWTGVAAPWRPALRGVLVMSACFLYVTAPYMLTIGKFSNRPSVGQLVHAAVDIIDGRALHDPLVCLASRQQDGVNGQRINGVKLWDAVKLVITAHGKAGHYYLWPLAAVGAVVFWRRRQGDPAIGLLGCMMIVNLVMLLRLAYTAGYTSERHTLVLVSIAAILGAVGLAHLIRAAVDSRRGRVVSTWICALVLGLLCVPKAVQPLHAGQEGHRQAGLWLDSMEQRIFQNTLIDPYLWVSFYSGQVTPWCSPKWDDEREKFRTSIHISPRTLGVVDPRDNDLNRLRDWQQAGVTGPKSVVIWFWPSVENPKLVLRQAP